MAYYECCNIKSTKLPHLLPGLDYSLLALEQNLSRSFSRTPDLLELAVKAQASNDETQTLATLAKAQGIAPQLPGAFSTEQKALRICFTLLSQQSINPAASVLIPGQVCLYDFICFSVAGSGCGGSPLCEDDVSRRIIQQLWKCAVIALCLGNGKTGEVRIS